MSSLDDFAQEKLAALEAEGLKRTLAPTHRLDGLWVERGGRKLLSLSCNDYLGLTHDPRVIEAAIEAARTYGTGAGASRLVTGDHPLIEELEARLAAFKGTEAACVFSSGYQANAGSIPTFTQKGDVVLIDERAHSCIHAGGKLSDATVRTFAHNDVQDLKGKLAHLRGAARHILIVTEGVFSMDGDIAPLGEISDLAKEYDAWLMTDDAHGVGVVGGGHGTSAMFPDAEIHLQMGTLSKALASQGGYVCGSKATIDLLKTRARTFVYSTGLAPASAGAAIKALEIVENEPELCARPLEHARTFARALNLSPPQSAIVPVVLETPAAVMAAQAKLEDAGYLVVGIRPPTVPEGTSRLRLSFTALFPDPESEELATAVRGVMQS